MTHEVRRRGWNGSKLPVSGRRAQKCPGHRRHGNLRCHRPRSRGALKTGRTAGIGCPACRTKSQDAEWATYAISIARLGMLALRVSERKVADDPRGMHGVGKSVAGAEPRHTRRIAVNEWPRRCPGTSGIAQVDTYSSFVRARGLNVTLQWGQERFFLLPDGRAAAFLPKAAAGGVERTVRLRAADVLAAFQPVSLASRPSGKRRKLVDEPVSGAASEGGSSIEVSPSFKSSASGAGRSGVIGCASCAGTGRGMSVCPSMASGCSERGPNTGRVGTGWK